MKNRLFKSAFSALLTFALLVTAVVPAYAESEVEVEGFVGVYDENASYQVSFSTADVEWYVTENSWPNVWNTASSNLNTTPYWIQNNSNGIAYEVELESFVGTNGDAAAIAGDLVLYFTGNLAADGMNTTNLSGGFTSGTTYTDALLSGASNRWEYGFTGTYNEPLTTTGYSPEYTLTVNFSIA